MIRVFRISDLLCSRGLATHHISSLMKGCCKKKNSLSLIVAGGPWPCDLQISSTLRIPLDREH